MSSEIILPVYCIRCKRPLAPTDAFCRACGQAQSREDAAAQIEAQAFAQRNAAPPAQYPPQYQPQYQQPQNPPHVVVVTQPVPQQKNTGMTFGKFVLTGMSVAGGIWLGCFGVVVLFAGAMLLLVLGGGCGSHK